MRNLGPFYTIFLPNRENKFLRNMPPIFSRNLVTEKICSKKVFFSRSCRARKNTTQFVTFPRLLSVRYHRIKLHHKIAMRIITNNNNAYTPYRDSGFKEKFALPTGLFFEITCKCNLSSLSVTCLFEYYKYFINVKKRWLVLRKQNLDN